jgi:LysM repeat protein
VQPYISITPILPAGTGINFTLTDEPTFQEVTGGSGSGGWQVVDRPRLTAALQWYDAALFQITLPVVISTYDPTGATGSSIEYACRTLRNWKYPVPGTIQPPILELSGPVEGTDLQWCLYSLQTTPQVIRDAETGMRYLQGYTIVLYQFLSTSSNSAVAPRSPLSPAQRAQVLAVATSGAHSRKTYAVRSGDTLQAICARELANANLWQQVAALNGIRDPGNLSAGQVLILI